MMVRDGVTFLNREDRYISLVGSYYWIQLPDDGEGWCDLPVWNPRNTEDGDISLVGSHDWIHLPDDGEGW
ncbi:unnamed protein product, partial [Staurois parvus]